MSDSFDALRFFHFLRPWWLLLIPLALLLWWRVRTGALRREVSTQGLAPHLAAALTVGGVGRGRLLPIDGLVAVLVLFVLGAAGPTWSHVPNPLVAQTAPLAVVINVSESMLGKDVAPSRLERAKQKVLDLVARRAGARTALIAYAGTAHRVVPLSEDPDVLKPFIEGLAPDVMPEPGRNASQALALAREALADEATPGAVLFVLDELDATDLKAFEAQTSQARDRLVFLWVGGSPDARKFLTRVPNAAVVRATPDTSDVREIERRVANAYREALARDDRQQWDDRGWLLAWPASLLALFWFRRGWTMHWAVLFCVGMLGLGSSAARAEGLTDWFLSPDQQGRLAYQDKRFDEAGKHFEDPLWKGFALFRAGAYSAAAEAYARVPGADGAFARGVAHVKGREYRKGIDAFEEALRLEPTHQKAARNLEVARAILAYLEKTREESDTGEGSEGADELVFDKEREGGFETEISGEERMKLETAEQWMRSVDTRTEDFLRIRFALEAARP